MANSYGYCPQCGAAGLSRERRFNGNDTCKNGHVYPSRFALYSSTALEPVQSKKDSDEKIAKLEALLETANYAIKMALDFGVSHRVRKLLCNAYVKIRDKDTPTKPIKFCAACSRDPRDHARPSLKNL